MPKLGWLASMLGNGNIDRDLKDIALGIGFYANSNNDGM